MSYEKGRLAAQSILHFRETVSRPFEAMAAEIAAGRTLSQTHFDQAHEFTEAMRRAIRIPIPSGDWTTDDQSTLGFLTRYMTHAAVDKGTPDYNEYLPGVHHTIISTHAILDMHRALPMHFWSQEIENDFRPWNENASLYEGPGFNATLAIGLAVARQIDKAMPIAIPHTDGMFLGTAVPCNSNIYAAKDFIHAYPTDSGAMSMTQPYIFTPYWLPRVTLHLQTYVPEVALSKDQSKLIQIFANKAYGDPETIFGFGEIMQSYMSAGQMRHPHDHKRLVHLADKAIKDVMSTDVWASATQAAKPFRPN